MVLIFSLPESWKDYKIVAETGSVISIKYPKWTLEETAIYSYYDIYDESMEVQ